MFGGGVVVLNPECGFFETLAPTTSKGITAGLLAPKPIIGTGVAAGSSGTAIVLATGSSAVDGETRYVGRLITITAGTGVGQSSTITAYTGSTRTATIAWPITTDGTSQYVITSGYDGLVAKEALIDVEAFAFRFRQDGVAPTASVGVYFPAGASMVIKGVDSLRKFRCIDTAAGASSVTVQVYF